MLWKELVKLALLGTDRSTLSSATKVQLQAYGIDTDKEITEVVLESAALQASLQKAGFQPKKWKGENLTKSPTEDLIHCSPKSANHLNLILNGRYPFALTEFVQTMADHRKCLPHELLPELLDKCIKDETLWNNLQPIIGNRGQWLISLNPTWQPLAMNATQEKWELGTKEERIAMLRTVRQQAPIEGLKLMLSTWAEDGLSEKVAFLKCLAVGLSDIDEAFLEECLDFPRKEIRENAAKLLSQLPNSQLQERIFSYLKNAITAGKENGQEKPQILLPALADNALLRDGINPKKKWRRGSATTGMLYQLVSILQPEKWEQLFDRPPKSILLFFTKSEWALMLVEGVAAAAGLHNSDHWKAAILRFWLAYYTNRNWTQLDVRPILDQLPNTVFNEVLFEKLKVVQFLPDEQSPLIQLLQKEGYFWEDRLTNLVMKQLKEWIDHNASYSWSGGAYRKMLKQAAYSVAPKMEKSLSQFWLGDARHLGGWEPNIQQFLNVLSFRKEMLTALEQ